MIITSVPKEGLDIVWEDVIRVLTKSIETSKGKFRIEDIYRDVESGYLGLWLIMDGRKTIAAITTRIIEYPNRKAMAMDWIGGSRMREWLPIAMKTLSKFSKENGCSHLEGYGRKAWSRWLQPYGWEPEYIAYRMELKDG
jgi:hypothetical protein|tara:strand:- start:1342 stop:1761 length:420 start_codon:yes stop_codon:yes gene_type:complete